MSRALESSRLKLERGQKHFEEANACVQAWRDHLNETDTRPFILDTNYEPDKGYYSVCFHQVQAVPTELSLIVGDCVHNLRSALDHLAWEIVPDSFKESATSGRLRDIAFPIIGDSAGWSGAITRRVPDVMPEQVAILLSRQPFEVQPCAPERSALAVLRDASNTDKHQTIVTAVCSVLDGIQPERVWVTADEPGFQVRDIKMTRPLGPTLVEEGAEVAQVVGIPIVGQAKPHVSVVTSTPPYVSFENRVAVLGTLSIAIREIESLIADIEATLP